MVQSSDIPTIGDFLLGRYFVEGVLGAGSSSTVFHIADVVTGSAYALKYPTQNVSAFLEREILFWLSLRQHANIVTLVSVDFDVHGRPWVVTEYAQGGTLRQQMTGRPWPVEAALPVLRDIAQGMAHANQINEIAHLDLKPENILFDQCGTAMVSDFGLVRHIRAARSGYASVSPRTGTVGYQAPEIVLATGKPNERSDIYSFGLIAFELLTGRLPFSKDENYSEHYRGPAVQSLAESLYYGTHELTSLLPDEQIRDFLSDCLSPHQSERTPRFQKVLSYLKLLGYPARSHNITDDERTQMQLNVPRRSLSRARIMHRQGDDDGALRAINKAVFSSKRDGEARAAALELGATILDDVGYSTKATTLRASLARPDADVSLALETPPLDRAAIVQPSGKGRRTTGADPWEQEMDSVPDADDPDDRNRHITAINEYLKGGRLHTALQHIRAILESRPVLGMRLATLVFTQTRTNHLDAAEPLTDLDKEDPRFDSIVISCDECANRGWAKPLGLGRPSSFGYTQIKGSADQTVFLQCGSCFLTVCPECRPRLIPPSLHLVGFPPCPDCAGSIRSAAATGLWRPWSHVLMETPIAAVIGVRLGVAPLLDDSWWNSKLVDLSPDVVFDETVPRFFDHIAYMSDYRDLVERAALILIGLIRDGKLDARAAERTETVCATDSDGTPFTIVKVLG